MLITLSRVSLNNPCLKANHGPEAQLFGQDGPVKTHGELLGKSSPNSDDTSSKDTDVVPFGVCPQNQDRGSQNKSQACTSAFHQGGCGAGRGLI